MKHTLNKLKKKENLDKNLNPEIIFKSNVLKNKPTINEKKQIRCEMNNEIFHYYW